ncbi:hypothetical protein FOXG_21796 [Fusarium oxysporum f. sp. lycopersici 4287]|uniref:Uncharacterized protein n=1 Tax=Fusarium oxysporum f. sp. lycopersici (strain 4287 / CBS 123668 / FGSC 9935 / NRRL 34936) TaxID=426428 RepID=A0A0J9WTX6_FUSO4|nr:hypothetical protein FOXG_21796 [Fusarium oxysporum f. sp. lycopersici 4287]KNB16797.1 hypothetical protein FOXG_21796 [Fusarium oxysporum f. sp. lycopersici 4287]
MDTNLFRCYESLYSNDTDSISGEGSSNDYEDSKEGDGDFEESEREDSLDGWMSDTDSRDAPDVSPFRRDLGHESTNRIAVESAEEFLELLFELSLSLTMEIL